MLKEQLFGFAMKAFSKAYEAKERIKNSLENGTLQSYVLNFRNKTLFILENQWQKFDSRKALFSNEWQDVNKPHKERKSSIKPAKEIGSHRADIILQTLKINKTRLVKKTDAIDSKKSLAYLVWALGHAERANLVDGISVHDVSALLYRSCKIELYPINISRVVFGHTTLIRQVSQEKRTKTYLLTEQGYALFKEKFL